MTTPTYEEVRRQNWAAAVRSGETTEGLAEWKNRPRATIEPYSTGFSIRWDGHPVEHRSTFRSAKRAARKAERRYRQCREFNEANA